jgi:hypothetical protein
MHSTIAGSQVDTSMADGSVEASAVTWPTAGS